MKNLKILAGLSLLTLAGAAHAGVSSTVTLASDYDFRGITQTEQDLALQASLDYAHDNGWYIGAWASNIDFGLSEPDYEVDLYTGFTFGPEGGPTYDVGLIYYAYPQETDFDYVEAYGSVAISWFKGKLWYSPDFGGDTTSGDTPAYYIEGNATIPLPQNFSVLLHAGYSDGDYWDELDDADAGRPYFDWSAGVGYTYSKFNFALKWIDGSDLKEADGTPNDTFSSESRVVLSVATTFPWTND